MINFIVYIEDKEELYNYKRIINSFMKKKKEEYKISLYSDNIDEGGKKIYLLDGNNTINIAKDIRYSNDWDSQIILSFSNNKHNNFNLIMLEKIFKLDILFKDIDWLDKLNMYLEIDYNIINRNKTLCFKYCNELFNILYSDICYIEKNLCDNVSTIVTNNNKYVINLSICKIMEILDNDTRFYKCHRSCIVNIDNIISYDMSSNIVKFKNYDINLIARNKKKELENKIIERCLI